MTDIENDDSDKPTKSQVKKAMTDLQKIGEKLITLSESQLETLPLPEILANAIRVAQTLKRHDEARRRHLQYIGKLMRKFDLAPIHAALQKILAHRELSTKKFHEIEKTRDELISQGDTAINQFIAIHPHADRQQLRQLVRNAQHDRAKDNKTGGELALFRYLRELLENE